MALKDLIINNSAISESILENILSKMVHLVKDNETIILTSEGNNLPNKDKVLLYLCGKKAWELLGGKSIHVSIEEIEKNLGIQGNTLRPILKSLKDFRKVESDKGKYRILPQGIFELDDLIKSARNNKGNNKINKIKKNKRSTGTKKFTSVSGQINNLMDVGFFDDPKDIKNIYSELKKRGITSVKYTSIPSYLLPLLRKNILVRDKQKTDKGMGNVWVYSKTLDK